MYLVDRIIERCENSSRDWREGATGGRTLRITQEDYDACGKEELIEEVQRLERAGLVTVKKWVVPDSDVELVAYQVEHLPDFYRLADSESGEEYWPKQAAMVVSEMKLRLSPNIAPPMTDATHSGRE